AAQIKWPNDVMLDRQKVAGVLAEMRDVEVVIGIGVNVNQTREQLPADARVTAASLRTVTGREHDRESLLGSLLAHLDEGYARWLERGLDGVYDDLGSRDFLRGRRIAIDGVAATGVMIDREGRLVVDVRDERRAVASGEIDLVAESN